MKRTTRTFAVPTLVLSGLLALSACGGDDVEMDDEPAAEEPAENGDNNDADIEFASGMVPHHEQAVEMSDMALEQGGPEVMALAEKIADAQGPEIETMTQWLDDWGAEMPEDMDMESMDMEGMDMEGMEGMMSSEDMEGLMQAEGMQFDTMWLEMMIEHHNGAIEMAETEVEEGENPDAISLAETIAETQEAEISEMEGLLESSG